MAGPPVGQSGGTSTHRISGPTEISTWIDHLVVMKMGRLLFTGPVHGGRLIDNRVPADRWTVGLFDRRTADSSECGLPVYRGAGPSHGRVAGPSSRSSSLN